MVLVSCFYILEETIPCSYRIFKAFFTEFQLWWDSLFFFAFIQGILVLLVLFAIQQFLKANELAEVFCALPLSYNCFPFCKRRSWIKQELFSIDSYQKFKVVYFPNQCFFEYVSGHGGTGLNERLGQREDELEALGCHRCFSLYLLHGGKFLEMSYATASWLDYSLVEMSLSCTFITPFSSLYSQTFCGI